MPSSAAFSAAGSTWRSGAAGPTVDIFFIRTQMDRRKIIATKAATQVVSHAAKVVFYWNAANVLSAGEWGAIALAAPFAIAGTSAGHWVLQRLTDANFRAWTRYGGHRHRHFLSGAGHLHGDLSVGHGYGAAIRAFQ